MAFIGNIVRSFISPESPSADTITEVSIGGYSHIPVISREDCLVLYGKTKDEKYELLFQKNNVTSGCYVFSLYRCADANEAQIRFETYKDVLIPLKQVIPQELLSISTLQKLCDTIKANPTWTVAHVAAYLGYTQAFAHPIINYFADTHEIGHKITPLHIAVERRELRVMSSLISLNVNIDALNNEGNSVFHIAAQSNAAIIQLLSGQECGSLNVPNNAGKTPLHLACEADKPDCVQALLIAGADVNVASQPEASLPIHSAIEANSPKCAKEIITMYPKQLYAGDMKHGGTPLHWATTRLMVNALVELGCKVNARNFHGSTALHNMVIHNRLDCVIALLSWGADPNIANDEGDTPLHVVNSTSTLQALLVFGGETSVLNNQGENVRHKIATSKHKKSDQMLHIVHVIGAARCGASGSSCNAGCSSDGDYDGVALDSPPTMRCRSHFDHFLDQALNNVHENYSLNDKRKGGRVLCLDGGGIKGLVLIQILLFIQKIIRETLEETPDFTFSVKTFFDWICGTSTGGILALALAMEKSLEYCQGLYLRLKDLVFVGVRPYSPVPLEEILKKEFGESAKMADITGIKVFVTGVLADRFPADLHMFRNYMSAERMLNCASAANEQFERTKSAEEQLIWHAARASGAAPSYFNAFGRFIDGGLIANNPTMDMLSEVVEYNTVCSALQKFDKCEKLNVVVSLGTGKAPVYKVVAIDVFRPESFFKTIQMAFGLSSMAKLLVDQVTMADNRTTDRTRVFCHALGVSYLRLSPQLSLDVQLDETRDDVLINMMWETFVYCQEKRNEIKKIVLALNHFSHSKKNTSSCSLVQ